MVDLLKQCKEWGEENLCYSSASIKNGVVTIGDDGLLNCRSQDEGIFCLCNIGYYYQMPSDFIENRLESNIKALDFVAINEASEHKATAWEFIKFLFGNEIQSSLFYFPVNRVAMEKRIDRVFHGINLTEDYENKKREVIEKFNSIREVSSISTYTYIILKEAKRYFKNEITAEQAANEMAQKVERYFKE